MNKYFNNLKKEYAWTYNLSAGDKTTFLGKVWINIPWFDLLCRLYCYYLLLIITHLHDEATQHIIVIQLR